MAKTQISSHKHNTHFFIMLGYLSSPTVNSEKTKNNHQNKVVLQSIKKGYSGTKDASDTADATILHNMIY